MKGACAVALVISIYGCAATGPSYQDFSQSIGVNQAKAHLFLFRTKETFQASARTASVKINGTYAAGVQHGGFALVEVQPGKHILTVDLPDIAGQCDLAIDTAAGNEYYFEVKPRVESLGGMGLIPALIAKGDRPWSPNRSECKGSFYAEPLEKNSALQKLKELKLSQ
jgi:hypothetical protein